MTRSKSLLVLSLLLATAGSASAAQSQHRSHAYSGGAYASDRTHTPAQAAPQAAGDPSDVLMGGRNLGRDPDPFIRNELRRHMGAGYPD